MPVYPGAPQLSTGPKTEEGKTASSQNNFRYGLTGNSFTVLDFEDQDEFDRVLCGLRFEHQPSTMTESILVDKMAQSYWLSKRPLPGQMLHRQRTVARRAARVG